MFVGGSRKEGQEGDEKVMQEEEAKKHCTSSSTDGRVWNLDDLQS
jgi:hypothetical protein